MYKENDVIICQRTDCMGVFCGPIVRILTDNPNADYVIQIFSFTGEPIEDEFAFVKEEEIIIGKM